MTLSFHRSGKKQFKTFASSSVGKFQTTDRERAHESRETYLQDLMIETQRRAAQRRNEMARMRRGNLAKGFAALDAELPEVTPRRNQVRVLNDATEYVRVLKEQVGEDMEEDQDM